MSNFFKVWFSKPFLYIVATVCLVLLIRLIRDSLREVVDCKSACEVYNKVPDSVKKRGMQQVAKQVGQQTAQARKKK
jgi:hypothetical protein